MQRDDRDGTLILDDSEQRVSFSPIDRKIGSNTTKSLEQFDLAGSGALVAATIEKLSLKNASLWMEEMPCADMFERVKV